MILLYFLKLGWVGRGLIFSMPLSYNRSLKLLIYNSILLQIRIHKLMLVENQSPFGVGVTRDLIVSTTDTTVEAVEDLPHF